MNLRKLNAKRNPYGMPICQFAYGMPMSHTATHLALGSKSEIQNALKSQLDYTFVIEKQEEPRKERKQKQKENNFYRKREETKTRKKIKYVIICETTVTYKTMISLSLLYHFP